MFFSPFSIAITSLGDERANFSAFRTFVRFVLLWFCLFSLPLGVWEACDCGTSWTVLLPFFDKPVCGPSMTDRLRAHLTAVNLYEWESSHSSRRGCAITLKMLDIKDNLINNHVGWGNTKMLEHYARIDGLYGQKGAAKRLSDAADLKGQGIPELCKISRETSALKNLRRFYFN